MKYSVESIREDIIMILGLYNGISGKIFIYNFIVDMYFDTFDSAYPITAEGVCAILEEMVEDEYVYFDYIEMQYRQTVKGWGYGNKVRDHYYNKSFTK